MIKLPVWVMVSFLALVLLIGGGQSLATGLRQRRPRSCDFNRLVREHDAEGWVKVTGCVIDMTGLSYKSFLGVGAIKEIYVPVRAWDDSPGKRPELWKMPDRPIRMLLKTTDAALLRTASELRQRKEADETLKYIFEHQHEVLISRPVMGTIAPPIPHFKLPTLHPGLARDFILLEDGVRPHPWMAGICLLAGVGLGVIAV